MTAEERLLQPRSEEEQEPLDITPEKADKLDKIGEQIRGALKGLTPKQIQDLVDGRDPLPVPEKVLDAFKKRKKPTDFEDEKR